MNNIVSYYKQDYFGINFACPIMVSTKLLKKHLVPPTLDVGCGQGLMVKKLKKENWSVFGCDVFPEVTSFGENFFVHDMEKNPTKQKFNSILCVHVLEHVFDYINFLNNIKESLNENGLLFLSVPNSYSLLCRLKFLFGNEKITLGVGEIECVESNKLEPHLRYFGIKSLTKILELNGFVVKEVFGSRNGNKSLLGVFAGQLNFVCRRI